MNLDPGVCFQIRGEGHHLKIAVTFQNKDGNVLLFGLTDLGNVEERLCIFDAGDHPFVTKPSVIEYRRRVVLPYSGFDTALLKFHPRFSSEQLIRIIEGAHRSDELEPRYQRWLPQSASEIETYVGRLKYIGVT